jgi:hypothetical protein
MLESETYIKILENQRSVLEVGDKGSLLFSQTTNAKLSSDTKPIPAAKRAPEKSVVSDSAAGSALTFSPGSTQSGTPTSVPRKEDKDPKPLSEKGEATGSPLR